MSESAQASRLVSALRASGCLVLCIHAHAQQGRGWPDVVAVTPSGAVLWLELKAGRGRLRPDQRLRIAQLRARRQAAFAVRDLRVLEDHEGDCEASLAGAPGSPLWIGGAIVAASWLRRDAATTPV